MKKAISNFEQLLINETKNVPRLKSISMSEFQERIEQSSEDSKYERLTKNSKLISEIKKWS